MHRGRWHTGAFTNDTEMPNTYNYFEPVVNRTINGVLYSESQRFYVSYGGSHWYLFCDGFVIGHMHPLECHDTGGPTFRIEVRAVLGSFGIADGYNVSLSHSQVAIVSNGDCASTCAQFSTLMYERHNTTIAVFGGKPGEVMQFKGMSISLARAELFHNAVAQAWQGSRS